MTYLATVLEHLGYEHRAQQDALFEHLLTIDRAEGGVIAQAGTGTGKSIAVLSAAAYLSHTMMMPVLVVCPTNVLLDQYINLDAPGVSAALGVTIRPLKGRNHYLCASGPGFLAGADQEMIDRLYDDSEVQETLDPKFGCPGSDECDKEAVCHYRVAKAQLADADIIVTNAHLLIIDNQLKAGGGGVDEDGLETESPRIFPDLGAVFVDEAHTLEEVARGFTQNSINMATVMRMGDAGEPLLDLVRQWERQVDEPREIGAHSLAHLATALRPLARWEPETGHKISQRQADVRAAAANILRDGAAGVFADRHRVLWFDPAREPKTSRIVGTDINLAAMMRQILTSQPYALVSATVPKTMAQCLGVRDARFVDVGHPFDYGRQAWIGFSKHSGDYRSSKVVDNFTARCDELLTLIERSQGGALLLFSSFVNLERVYARISPNLLKMGLLVLKQHREGSDKNDLGRQFKQDGNAVLFGSASFAMGFDCPGPALRLVGIWNLAYPGLDPVTKAIQASNRQRYEDMMLVSTTQAIGRLIRTTSDYGVVWVADSRGANKLLGGIDPMTIHLREFQAL